MPQDSSAQAPLSFISHTFAPSHTLSDPAASPSYTRAHTHTRTHKVCKASVYEIDTGQAVQYEWIDTMHASTFPGSSLLR